jgi:hypothetical protein
LATSVNPTIAPTATAQWSEVATSRVSSPARPPGGLCVCCVVCVCLCCVCMCVVCRVVCVSCACVRTHAVGGRDGQVEESGQHEPCGCGNEGREHAHHQLLGIVGVERRLDDVLAQRVCWSTRHPPPSARVNCTGLSPLLNWWSRTDDVAAHQDSSGELHDGGNDDRLAQAQHLGPHRGTELTAHARARVRSSTLPPLHKNVASFRTSESWKRRAARTALATSLAPKAHACSTRAWPK